VLVGMRDVFARVAAQRRGGVDERLGGRHGGMARPR
jgi:hypothetical protein